MKILCINTNGLHNDGITNNILNYFKHMDQNNTEIHILETKATEESMKKSCSAMGLRLVYTAHRKHVLKYLIKTALHIRREKYDIVHVHGSSALLFLDLLAARLGGCKIRIAHSRNTSCSHPRLDQWFRPFFITFANL